MLAVGVEVCGGRGEEELSQGINPRPIFCNVLLLSEVVCLSTCSNIPINTHIR